MQHAVPAIAPARPRSGHNMRSIVHRAQSRKPRNLCAMIIDGEAVWVDINRYEGSGPAVVIEHNGRIRLIDIEAEALGYKLFGARTALGGWFPSGLSKRGMARNSVIVVGMVIDAPIRGDVIEGELA
ncbi:hypothetical protein CES85_5869 (plasmid) [Ochrobactrum quorumnocens]|uniref:Uncharacterized protein n=1 Tax=Ochrobactrum quorumnocens TaxID=271865 RepID=A0A248U8X6_9HYPH|nr:hypothetical protein [[Ochrobactrum] quorumnocens]ASV83042.1 hypothetical protein CES85_5869 [[Ochrobactrum] quorumnocens]